MSQKRDYKQTYMKTETCKLYSRDFWIFLPNIIKIDPYNFELYRFKVGSFFLRHSVYQCKSSGRNVTQISICTALFKQHLTWVTFSSILKTITSHSKRSKWSTFQLDVGCRCANHRENSMVGTTDAPIRQWPADNRHLTIGRLPINT